MREHNSIPVPELAMSRRQLIKKAPLVGAGLIIPTVALGSSSELDPFTKVRSLSAQLSEALKEAGDCDYVFVRPAGVDSPVLAAHRSQPGDLANFFFREYQETVSGEGFRSHERHIRQLAYLISALMEHVDGPEYIMIRPLSVGDYAVSEYTSIRT